ncbi:MAG: c-type cytochrome [Nitrospinota bacterium]
MKKILGLSLATVFAISFSYVPTAFADAATGKKIFNTKTKTVTTPCKQCHKPTGDPAKFKPVGPGLKGLGKRYDKERLQKWLSPKNVELWGDALDA